MPNGDETIYYVISDLHIGGDEQLEKVDFHDELIEFLQRLEEKDEDVELIINGDAFGLWEFTDMERQEKLDELFETYPELFEQFRRTGEAIPVTLLPGNHDYELVVDEESKERLADYNINLVQQEESITRELNDRVIWFEHGHQRDPHNRIEDYGSPNATPLGYFMNTYVTSRAGRVSDRGRFNWLKDIQAVTPSTRIPTWLVSKYVYREMNPFLRWAAIPFLFLFNISVIFTLLAGLDYTGIWSMPFNAIEAFASQFGQAGRTAFYLLSVNAALVGLLLAVGAIAYVFLRDIRGTLHRFGLFDEELQTDLDGLYLDAASEVFEAEPDTAVFCYGHTHRPDITEHEDRLLVNSGTWLKRLHRRDAIAGRLPPVFSPSYQLTVVRIEAADDGVAVSFEEIQKSDPEREELSVFERFLTRGREPDPELPEPWLVTDDEAVPQSRSGKN